MTKINKLLLASEAFNYKYNQNILLSVSADGRVHAAGSENGAATSPLAPTHKAPTPQSQQPFSLNNSPVSTTHLTHKSPLATSL